MTGYCETPSLHPLSETLQVIYKPVLKGGKAFVYKMSKTFTLICTLPGTRSLSLALPQLGHETARSVASKPTYSLPMAHSALTISPFWSIKVCFGELLPRCFDNTERMIVRDGMKNYIFLVRLPNPS